MRGPKRKVDWLCTVVWGPLPWDPLGQIAIDAPPGAASADGSLWPVITTLSTEQGSDGFQYIPCKNVLNRRKVLNHERNQRRSNRS